MNTYEHEGDYARGMCDEAAAQADSNARAQAEYEMSQQVNSPIGVLRLFETSQTGIDRFSDLLIESVKGGNVNALELKAFFKAMEMIIERVAKETKPEQMRESEKWQESTFNAYGIQFTKADVYTVYNFEGCNDPQWMLFNQQVISAKKSLSERETFLKTLKATLTFVDNQTGEIVKINPPNKKSTPGLKLSIK